MLDNNISVYGGSSEGFHHPVYASLRYNYPAGVRKVSLDRTGHRTHRTDQNREFQDELGYDQGHLNSFSSGCTGKTGV
jgi:hypothetical protein